MSMQQNDVLRESLDEWLQERQGVSEIPEESEIDLAEPIEYNPEMDMDDEEIKED